MFSLIFLAIFFFFHFFVPLNVPIVVFQLIIHVFLFDLNTHTSHVVVTPTAHQKYRCQLSMCKKFAAFKAFKLICFKNPESDGSLQK